jgi:hypothetical protein
MVRVTADTPQVKRLNLRALVVSAVAGAVAVTSLAAGSAVGAQPGRTAVLDEAGRVTFRIASFNVLGSTHTQPRARLARMGSGVERIGLALRLLDKRAIDVVGFQEMQIDQFTEFYRLAGDRFGVYPGGVDRRSVQNSIAWRLDTWRFVEGHTVSIPYFDGIEWPMPVVQLQNTLTGQVAYFANFHNPATNRRHRGNDVWREEAMRRQIALANSLYYETGLPVFFTGDMNERDKYFCPMVAGAPMKAANGGSVKNGVCTLPPRPVNVDWIFGAKQRGRFTGFVRDDGPLVNRITDHPVIYADVRLKPAPAYLPPPPDPSTDPLPTEPVPPTAPTAP